MKNLMEACAEAPSEAALAELEAEHALHVGRAQSWVATLTIASVGAAFFGAALLFQLELVLPAPREPETTVRLNYPWWLVCATGVGVLAAFVAAAVGVRKVGRHRRRAAVAELRHARLMVVYVELSADRRAEVTECTRPVRILSVARAGAELSVSTRLRLGLPRRSECKCGGRI